MKGFDLVLADGPQLRSGDGTIKRRIALRIDGEDTDVAVVTLDSTESRRRQAKRWAKSHGLLAQDIEEKLRKAALTVVSESQTLPAEVKPVKAAESPPKVLTLSEARVVYDLWLSHLDEDLLDVVFGTLFAHRLDGDPVWLFPIGAPGDGKTELLRSLAAYQGVVMLSSLTPGALISGYITDGPDPSLLPKLDGKVLIVKDFTAILDLPSESRAEIFGQLRDAYDGEASKAFGTGECRRYRSRFGLLAGVTGAIDTFWSVSAALGERFLRFRLRGGGRQEKVLRAMQNVDTETAMREQLSQAALGVLARTHKVPTLPNDIRAQLGYLADFVALGRSHVARDKQNVVQYVPTPEVGTRVAKALTKLALGVAMARGVAQVDEPIMRIVRRVAFDTLPSMRGRILQVLWRHRTDEHKTAVLGDAAEIPTDTAKNWLDDLRLLGIVERGGEPHGGYMWRLRGQFVEIIGKAGLAAALDDDIGSPPDSATLTDSIDPTVRIAESPPDHQTGDAEAPCAGDTGLRGADTEVPF